MARVDLQSPPDDLARSILEQHGSDAEWLDAFQGALERRRSGRELERVLSVWGLNQSEAAALFGVSRQAVSKWLKAGYPASLLGTVAQLSAATDLLARHLKRDRIPAVVRRPAPALGGRSLLDLVREGRTRDLLEACRSMFDFSRVQA